MTGGEPPGRPGRLHGALAGFLPRQRWFAGKGRRIDRVDVRASVPLRHQPPALEVLVADVAYADGAGECYQLPLGRDRGAAARALAERAPDAVVLHDLPDGAVVYDACRDERLGAVVLELLAAGATVGGLRFHRGELWDGQPAGVGGRPLGAEQSNSSLVFGERVILKLFRRLQPGENPELELTRALVGAGFDGCAPPLGWIDGFGATLGILQPFYAGAAEGWQLATDRSLASVQGRASSDSFADAAGELGAVTAALHRALAAALPQASDDGQELASLGARLRDQLEQLATVAPEVAGQRAAIEAVHAKAAAAGGGQPLQRIHGDYHLGQVLRLRDGGTPATRDGGTPATRDGGTPATRDGGWVVMDFEGEPARGIEERRRLASPLRDVAGMLRSFDYAAFQPLLGGPVAAAAEQRALAWAGCCRQAFLAGYAAEAPGGGGAQGWPGDQAPLLAAFELDKALYEVLYEARHRPAWLPVPLGGIRRLLGS